MYNGKVKCFQRGEEYTYLEHEIISARTEYERKS